MSNDLTTAIEGAKDKFHAILQSSPDISVEWQKESMFAFQQISKNDYSLSAARNNLASFRNAIINIASIGLSLNPATSYAYLVPRDGEICLDVSYKGLIKIATDTGSILWAKADIVYSTDSFEYNGPAQVPTHKADVFAKDRGEVVGAYCIAKTCDGDYLIETMTEQELIDIKSKSKSTTGKGAAYSPWNTFPNEMRKKAVIKRASKTWPKTERHERLDKVIEYVNNEEGINFDDEPKEEDCKTFDDYVHQRNGAALMNLFSDDHEYWSKVMATFYQKGKTTKYKQMIRDIQNESVAYIKQVIGIMTTSDHPEAMEVYEELNNYEQKLFWDMIEPEDKLIVDGILKVAA